MAQLKEKNNEQTKNEDTKPVVKSASQIANLKQLKIQSGALKRYTKELQLYLKELDEQKKELDDIRSSNDDEKESKTKKVKLKQQRQAIDETDNVIQDIRPKLVKTWETVDSLLKDLDGLAGDEEDQKLLADAKVFLENAESLVND